VTELLPGMTGLTQIAGPVGAGIRVGQFLNRQGFSRWEHAFTVLPGGMILEAEPGGAVIRPMHYADQDVYWCTGIYRLLLASTELRGEALDTRVQDVGERLKGTGYSFLDYDALAAYRLHVPDLRTWPERHQGHIDWLTLREYITTTGHMICSQMADEFQLRLGCHVFTDNRLPQNVTPAGLWHRDTELLVTVT
jgi:hypothetical protein